MSNLERAREFIAGCFVADAHFDLPLDLDVRRKLGEKEGFAAFHAPLLRQGGVDCIIAAIFVPNTFAHDSALRIALDQISSTMTADAEGGLALCRDLAQADRAAAEGRVAAFLSLEGAEPLGNDIGMLQIFHSLGVRLLGLAWSRRNYAADGCSFAPLREGQKGGLTAFGVDLVEEAERLGIILDISHLNDEGVRDLANYSKGRVIASHSNCRAVNPVMRNLTDEQIRFVASRDGVVGMNGISYFVKEGEDVGITDLVTHMDHVIALVGDDHLCCGLDCCDNVLSYATSISSVKSHDVVTDHSQLPALVSALFDHGYSDERVSKILGGNLRRVLG